MQTLFLQKKIVFQNKTLASLAFTGVNKEKSFLPFFLILFTNLVLFSPFEATWTCLFSGKSGSPTCIPYRQEKSPNPLRSTFTQPQMMRFGSALWQVYFLHIRIKSSC